MAAADALKNQETMSASERIRGILLDRNLDAVLVTDPYNFHYLSGFSGEGLLYMDYERSVLLTDSRYTIAAREAAQPHGFSVIEYGSPKPLIRHLKELIVSGACEKIGFEDLSMTCSDYTKYKRLLPDLLQWQPLGDTLNALRRVKTADEIEKLAAAEHIGDLALELVLPKIRVGMTETQLAAELEYAMRLQGAEGMSFGTIVASGENSARPHHVPVSSKKLEEGDFITMDFGCILEGYCSDMTRTVVLGKASEQQKKVYDTVLKAQLAGLSAIRAGRTGAQVDAAARRIINEAGFAGKFGHGLGHSVGLFIHEDPRLSPSEMSPLEVGNIVTVEPGVYIEGFGGVRIEDMVVVTQDGCRNLASSPKELIELPC